MQQYPKSASVEENARDRDIAVGDEEAIQILGDRAVGEPTMIRTPGRFSFVELPAELRIKIYNLLLLSDEPINMPLGMSSASSFKPCVSLLRICKLVDEEASPMLYGKNTFTISLSNSSDLANLLSKFRWSTLRSINLIRFTSTGPFTRPNPIIGHALPAPYVERSGDDMMARCLGPDIQYSPNGPDRYMVLHLATWISTAVTRAELSAVQRDLEALSAEAGE